MPLSNLHSLADEELIEGLFALDKDKPHQKTHFHFVNYEYIILKEGTSCMGHNQVEIKHFHIPLSLMWESYSYAEISHINIE